MVFSSNVFLFLFLPAFLAVYYLTPTQWRSWAILFGSYLFYGWWRADFLLLFVGVTLWNYLIGLVISRSRSSRQWLILGVTGNLATLGYFKYANFDVESFNALLVQFGAKPFEIAGVILPIGISFYIFQAISYIVDVYRGDAEPTRNPVDFAAFIALFPQLIAGPVLRYKDLAHQFRNRTHSLGIFSEGVTRFMQGFVKKVLIADTLAPLADNSFSLAEPSMGDAWLGALAYTAQLYFDFSGYCDMAIGLGLMMGFRFMENFNQPYLSQSITEFWRRWHISLSTWLRDYLYIPLGGNRRGTPTTYRNLLLTMLLGGLWHGANWTYVLWGAWHGLLLAIERVLRIDTSGTGFRAVRWLLTFFLVVIGWVMFRAETVEGAVRMYHAMFDIGRIGISELYAGSGMRIQWAAFCVAYLVVAMEGMRYCFGGARQSAGQWRGYLAETVMLPLFLLSILKLSSQSYSPFLYFQF